MHELTKKGVRHLLSKMTDATYLCNKEMARECLSNLRGYTKKEELLL